MFELVLYVNPTQHYLINITLFKNEFLTMDNKTYCTNHVWTNQLYVMHTFQSQQNMKGIKVIIWIRLEQIGQVIRPQNQQ